MHYLYIYFIFLTYFETGCCDDYNMYLLVRVFIRENTWNSEVVAWKIFNRKFKDAKDQLYKIFIDDEYRKIQNQYFRIRTCNFFTFYSFIYLPTYLFFSETNGGFL